MKLLLLSLFFSLSSCGDKADANAEKVADREDGLYAEIVTDKGNIMLQLEFEKAPVTVGNFVSLAEGTNEMVDEQYKGKKYFNGLKFHRVVPNFVIQGGDPLGTGAGNPGYKFPDEFHPDLKHDSEGILSMANAGPGTNGSQFFITHRATPNLDAYVDGELKMGGSMHAVFGKVVSGMDVVNKIAQNDIIKEINIIRKGKAAKKYKAFKAFKDGIPGLEAKAKEWKDKIAAEKARQEKDRLERMATIDAIKGDYAKTFETQKTKAKALPSGIKIFTNKSGNGAKPAEGDKVPVNYAGFLTDGTLFDTVMDDVASKLDLNYEMNKQRGKYKPYPMQYSQKAQLIPGFREALLTMKKGDNITVFIPAELGYGARSAGTIPPNSDLIFILEIPE